MPHQNKLIVTVNAFEQWRNTRVNSGARIPEPLRQQAVALLDHYSISKITKALRVSHSQLKDWAGLTSQTNNSTRFVKLPVSNENPEPDKLNLELRFNNGCQLRLGGELSPTIISSLVQLLASQNGAPS